MDEMESLSHTNWECKYHAVFIPKCRRKTLYRELRQHLGEVFRKLATQKESRIEEGHLLPDHVPMMSDTAEVCGVASDRVCQREERDSPGNCVWGEEEEHRGPAFLGVRVLRVHGGARDGDWRLHPEPGARGQALGPNESVALTGHRSDGPRTSGPR